MNLRESVCSLFTGEDDGKEDDGQSVASPGEEYEPISDDELDEILADSQKKEDQQDEEKITGTWKCLYKNNNHMEMLCKLFSFICSLT